MLAARALRHVLNGSEFRISHSKCPLSKQISEGKAQHTSVDTILQQKHKACKEK